MHASLSSQSPSDSAPDLSDGGDTRLDPGRRSSIGLADEIGPIEVGKAADLLILTMDPLDDIRGLSDLAVVIKNGEIVG